MMDRTEGTYWSLGNSGNLGMLHMIRSPQNIDRDMLYCHIYFGTQQKVISI